MTPRAKGISHVVLYASSSWLAGVLALGGLFVFVRHVSAAEFGVFTIWNTTTTVVSAGAAQWLRQAVLRYSSRHQDDRAVFLRTVWGLTAATCAVVGVVALSGYALPVSRSFSKLYIFATLSVMMTTINMVQLSIWQASFRPGMFSLSKVTIVAGNAVFGLLFLKSGWVAGAEALALGSLTGTAVGVAGGVVIDTIRRLSSPRPPRARWIDLKIARDVAVFGVPMIGWFLCTYALTVTDKTALATWSTLSDVGAYGALMSIATGVASLLITPLVMACHPTMAAAWNLSATREEPTMVVNAYLKAFALLAAPTIVFVWAAEPQIAALLLPAGYGHSRTLFALLTAAMLTSMLGLLAHKGLEMAEATGTLFGLMFSAVVLNILLLIVLVPRAGAVGAAVAVLLTQIAYVGGALVASRRYVRMSLRPQFLANIAVATAAAAFLTPILTRGFITLPLALRLLSLGISASLLYFTLLGALARISWSGAGRNDWLEMWRAAAAWEGDRG